MEGIWGMSTLPRLRGRPVEQPTADYLIGATRIDECTALARVPLFQGLTADQLALLRPALRRKYLIAEAELVGAEEPGDAAYLIVDGFVRIQMTEQNGEEIILAILGPGNIVGEMSLVDSLGRSATAIAHQPVDLFVIERSNFTAMLQQIPVIAYNLTRILSRRLRLANALAASLAVRDVDGRIGYQLLAYADEYGVPSPEGAVRLPFHLTQSHLAALVGATRVRVNQVLGDYKRCGLLTVDEHHAIAIPSAAQLRRHLSAL